MPMFVVVFTVPTVLVVKPDITKPPERLAAVDTSAKVLCRVLQPRVEVLSEVPDMIGYIIRMEDDYDLSMFAHKKMKTSVEQAREVLPKILEVYEGLDVWTEESLLDALKALVEELGVKNGQIYWPARIAITGCVSTAGGATEIAAILGREETLRRMRASLARLEVEA